MSIHLYLGGTRSGKSEQAEALALQGKGAVLYVATSRALADDAAMADRIRRHRERRPAHWQTLECPTGLAGQIAERLAHMPATLSLEPGRKTTVLVDCVTMWVANLLFDLPEDTAYGSLEHRALAEVEALIALMRTSPCRYILVSGETGLGGIHAHAQTREFCDCLGLVNQRLAAVADRAWFCVAGKKFLLED